LKAGEGTSRRAATAPSRSGDRRGSLNTKESFPEENPGVPPPSPPTSTPRQTVATHSCVSSLVAPECRECNLGFVPGNSFPTIVLAGGERRVCNLCKKENPQRDTKVRAKISCVCCVCCVCCVGCVDRVDGIKQGIGGFQLSIYVLVKGKLTKL
jgi:hypothetical protein